MKKRRNRKETRRKILEATHKLLREGGYLTRFSLDAVAKEAGVSKGGLMHHFASKDALLQAAARDAIDKFEARMEQEVVAKKQQAGGFTRSYVNVVLGKDGMNATELSPILLNYMRLAGKDLAESRFQHWQERTDADGIDVDLATIVRLAVDGLIYTEMIDSERIDEARRVRIRERLLQMLEKVDKSASHLDD